MTLHYIAAHGYQPPEQFLKDLRDKWTTEGVIATEFPYGPNALEGKLEARTLARLIPYNHAYP